MKGKKLLALMLSIIMVVSMLPVGVFAAYDATRTPKYDGDGIEVYDDGDGTYTLELLDGTATQKELYAAFSAAMGEPAAGAYSSKSFKYGSTTVLDQDLIDGDPLAEGDITVQKSTGKTGSFIQTTTYGGDTTFTVKVYHKIDVVTNPTTIGGVKYNNTPYANGASFYVYTGETIETQQESGYGAVASGVGLNPTASGTLTVTYSSTVADVVVGSFGSEISSVTVNGTSVASGATATVNKGEVTVAAVAADTTGGSYTTITITNGDNTVASGVGSVTFTADASETYSVSAEAHSPAIVVSGTEIDYNNANKTDYTTLENEIKALVTSVAGSTEIGTLAVTYKAGDLAGYKSLGDSGLTGHDFGEQNPETVRITSGSYVLGR